MLRVTVELVPGGVGEPQLLGQMNIANVDRELHERTRGRRGSYYFVIGRRGVAFDGVRPAITPLRTGEVHNWPRLSRSVWELVAACLDQAGYVVNMQDTW